MQFKLKKQYVIMIILTVLFLINATPVKAAEKEKTIVKVGYFDLGDYYKIDDDGKVNSYDAAYLSEIEKYTDYVFEYVACGTWGNAIKMMEAHEIDLVGTMQWTLEREETYDICDASYGYSVAELAARGNSDYIYEDYNHINGAKVGCIGGYVIINQLNDYMNRQNISFSIETYNTQTELDNALDTGEIDLIAANAHAIHDDWKVIEKFAYAPFYFASWKGNSDVTETISTAIIQIHIYEADFSDRLIQQYFSNLVNSPYTKEELDCINEKEKYTIYLDGNSNPLVWYDENSMEMRGVIVEICKQLTEQTGVQLEIKRIQDETGQTDDEHTVSNRTIYYDSNKDAREETGVTKALLDQEFEMYHRVGENYNKDDAYEIGIVKNRDGLRDYLEENFPSCILVEYDTPAECMEALRKGKVSLSFLNANVAQHILITEAIDRITMIPMTSVTFGIALQFNGKDADKFANIIDKGMQMVDDEVINQTMVSYAMNTAPNVTIFYLIRKYFGVTIIICIFLLIIFLTIAVLFTYARVMKRQKIKVEQANQDRTDFFARMSHDMRTPMNGILGMAKLSKDESDVDVLKQNILKIEDSSEFMLSLINDTLDLQRLESGKLKFNMQPVEVLPYFQRMIDMVRTTAAEKNIEIKVNLDSIISGVYLSIDSIRVKQIFMNLISNAIKFTPENGKIEVDLKKIKSTDTTETYELIVMDSGIGMSKEFIDNKLFHAYSQEYNAESDKYAGSGLGLAITKNLVELMNGEITVESQLGDGTRFVVIITFDKADGKNLLDGQLQRERNNTLYKEILSGKKILVVEDNSLNAEILIRLLKKVECEVIWAENGLDAVKKIEESDEGYYNAVLMDIRMPVMNGIESTREIRKLNRRDAETIPIIAVSANAYDNDIKACLDAGMNTHLAKPVDVTALYELLSKYLKMR